MTERGARDGWLSRGRQGEAQGKPLEVKRQKKKLLFSHHMGRRLKRLQNKYSYVQGLAGRGLIENTREEGKTGGRGEERP